MKDGLLLLDAGRRRIGDLQRRVVSGLGQDYLIVVLSTGSPSEDYGIGTIDELLEIVWRQLAEARYI